MNEFREKWQAITYFTVPSFPKDSQGKSQEPSV